MILHIISRKVFPHPQQDDCLRQMGDGDSILLLQDGVLAAVDTPANRVWLAHCPPNVTIYALVEDLQARGLAEFLLASITPLDYSGFVDLVEQHPLSQTWF